MNYLLLLAICFVCYSAGHQDEGKLKCHKQYEESKCVFECPPEATCRNRFIRFNCLRTAEMRCTERCVCKDSYYRNEIGECNTSDQCDQCSGPNEYYSCGSACDNVCDTLDTQNQTNCPIVNVICNRQCYCTEGTARNDKHICVPIEDC